MKRVGMVLSLLFCALLLAGASLDGTWRLRYETEAGVVDTTSTFRTEGERLLLVSGGSEEPIGTIKDGAIEFVVPDGLRDVGFTADLVVSARLSEGKITGYYEYLDYAGEVTGVRARD